MNWIELSFKTTHEASDLLAEFLTAAGADGIQVQDASEIMDIIKDPASLTYADEGFIEQLDPAVQVKAYFAKFTEGIRYVKKVDFFRDKPADKEWGTLEDLVTELKEYIEQFRAFMDMGEGYLGHRTIADADWAENWKKYYQTLHLTSRLVINPSWLSYSAAPQEIVVTMDPGSAFGTGTHETTILCAEKLDQLVKQGDTVLDLGTGSGILAIIAALIGAGHVEAIDIDPMAISVAQQNIIENEVEIDCHTGQLADAHLRKYGLIVANILADVILELLPDLNHRLEAGGLLIASGIIDERGDEISRAALADGMELVDLQQRNDWIALTFRRTPQLQP